MPTSIESLLSLGLSQKRELARHILLSAQRERAKRLSPLQWNRYFLAHHFPAEPADFHDWLNQQLTGLHTRRGSRTAVIAPREGAKSTWLTLAYVLRAAVEGWEPHIVILSDSGEMATQFLSAIRTELEANELLRAVYPEACGQSVEWRADRIRLANGVLVKSLGRGSNIRGRKDKQHRPSLIVVDDCQSNRNIDSPTDRERTISWFMQEVIPAGTDRTNFLSVGSALHRDALAVYLQSRPGWTGRTFQAVHEWPTRMDLWGQWELLATNLADDRRNETADSFLSSNRADMLAGAVSFWPAYKPIDVLMKRRAEIGTRRFETEYQGVPGTLEGAEWPSEYFDRPDFWFTDWPDEIVLKLQSLDPSKGATDKSDYQAHIMLGLHRFGGLYVDCELRREPNWVERAIDIAADWKPIELIAEANNTMGLMQPAAEQILKERADAKRPVRLNYNERIVTVNKNVRIRTINDYLRRGQIHIRNTAGGRMLTEQLRDWPLADYDDGPDALASAVIRLEELV
jgi:hypothetical protein